MFGANRRHNVRSLQQLYRRVVNSVLLLFAANGGNELLPATLTAHLSRAAHALHLLTARRKGDGAGALPLTPLLSRHLPRGREQLEEAARVQPANHAQLACDVRGRHPGVAGNGEHARVLAGVVLRVGGDQVLGAVVGVEALVLAPLEGQVLRVDHGRPALHVGERADVDHAGILFAPRLIMRRTAVLQEGGHQLRELDQSEVIGLTRLFDAGGGLDVRVNHADTRVIDEDVDVQLLALYRLHAIRNRFWILHIHEKILRNQRGGLGQPRGVGFPIPLSSARTRLSPVLRCDILCVAAKQHSHPESRALLLAIGSLQRDSRNHYCLPMRNTEFPSVQ